MQSGGFQFDLERARLVPAKGGEAISLRPQLVTLVAALVARPGRLVSREELQEALWGETEIDAENGLNFCIRQLRELLGDDAKNPRFVQTVPRRGYVWIASLEEPAAPEPAAPPHRFRLSRRNLVRAGAVAALLGTISAGITWLSRGSEPETARRASGSETRQEPRPGATRQVEIELQDQLMEARLLTRADCDQLGPAAEILRQILEQEPGWAPALEELTHVELRRAALGPESLARTVTRLEAVLEEHDNVETRLSLAHLHYGSTWDFAAARRHLERALELDPRHAETYRKRATLEMILGRHEEALALVRVAMDLDPVQSLWPGSAFLFFHFARRYEEALELAEQALRLNDDHYNAWFVKTIALEKLGRFDEAARAAARVLEFEDLPSVLPEEGREAIRVFHRRRLDARLATAPEDSWILTDRALGYAYHGEADAAFAALDEALERRSVHLTFHLSNPRFDPIRDDPRWRRLLERLGLADHSDRKTEIGSADAARRAGT